MGDHLKSFGLDFMGYDLPTGKEEIFLIPKRTNACTQRRLEITIISNSIGQGEVLMTQFN
jgi:cell division protein FtsI/penicillin-binding protein 2